MDNFGVKKNDQKNNCVENDHYSNEIMENKKNSYLG